MGLSDSWVLIEQNRGKVPPNPALRHNVLQNMKK
jgi:hypothetical protein